MRRWLAGTLVYICVAGIAASGAAAQDDEAAKANALWNQGKRLDALPLYEDLVKAYPNEWVYAERLASAVGVKAEHSNDPAEVKALLTRERDLAARAVQLGDPEVFVKLMAQINPDDPILKPPTSPAIALFNEAERAYGTGDYTTALAKYGQAADADPTMYAAALYAGDSAYVLKDVATAVKWFTRAVAIDPNRETAYRYWGDTLLRIGNDPVASKSKYLEAVVAEPYNKLAWNGITFWARAEKAVILAPRIDRPVAPTVDPAKPNNITIDIDPEAIDQKKKPGSYAWLGYSMTRATFRGDAFKKAFPDEKQYRHSLKEEDAALSSVAAIAREGKVKREKLDESLRNLLELEDGGMLDCWILISAADDGIAADYAGYRDGHRQLMYDYLERFVVHGGGTPPQ